MMSKLPHLPLHDFDLDGIAGRAGKNLLHLEHSFFEQLILPAAKGQVRAHGCEGGGRKAGGR